MEMASIRDWRKYGISIFCWLVKIAGIGMLLLILAIAIGEGPPNPFRLAPKELFLMVWFLAIMIGMGLAVWRQLVGGIVTLVGIGGFTIFAGAQGGWVFHAFWLIGLLNILCWCLVKYWGKDAAAADGTALAGE